ncbi:MAG: DUF932 domain-containing protein [Fimbriimonadaceae bacterium]|nr:DUF932 domain-containing protein [Fimbriimonadaceae bacterium]
MVSTYDHTQFERHCEPLTAFLQRLRESHERKFDEVLSLAQLQLDDECRLGHNGAEFTGRGIAALAHLVDMPPAVVNWLSARDYDRELSQFVNSELIRLKSQDAQANRADRRVFARFRGDGQGRLYCRGLFSDRYAAVDSWPLMQMVTDSLTREEQQSARVHRMSYDGDELTASLFWPGSERMVNGEAYRVGVAVQTSEVGTLRLRVSAWIGRLVCSNGLIVNSDLGEFVSRRHVGRIDMQELAQGVRGAVACAMEKADRALVQLDSARNILVTDADRTIVQLSRELRLTKDQTRAWLDGHETTINEPGVREVSAFSVVNGLTRGAQNHEFEATTRSYMEWLAGRILAPSLDSSESGMGNWWSELQLRARSLSDEVVAGYRE